MFYKEDPPNFLLKGGQTIDLGRRSPWWGGRKEGTSDLKHSWSQFLVGFIHPVWWHPPDNGRLRQAVADAEQPQVGDHPSQPAVWRPSFFLIFATTGRSPRHPLSSEDIKMEALVAIYWEEENLEQVREGPPRTCYTFLSLLSISFHFLFSLSMWKVKVVL